MNLDEIPDPPQEVIDALFRNHGAALKAAYQQALQGDPE